MYEINLVPDIKEQVIKAQRVRNLIFFVCIVVSAAAVGVVLLLLVVKGAQDIKMSGQDKKLEQMSIKINSYKDLNELLTLQGQLNKIDEIGQKKKVFSRVFSIIGTLLPTNADKITISELDVNLGENTFTIEGQADAGEKPDIDYRVLESFKKSMLVTTFDYGRFVDKNNLEIPTRCIVEADEDGNMYKDGDSVVVYWERDKKGCDPSRNDEEGATEEMEEETSNNEVALEEEDNSSEDESEDGASINDDEREIIYRTPKFSEWYSDGMMDTSGNINGVPHFESKCITYTATGGNKAKDLKWITNNTCNLATGDMIVIDEDETKNARDENGKLVLKFKATIYLSEEVLSFQNKHMIAIAPSGRQNMTDSYLQIGGMFAKPAVDCAPDDTACLNNQQNTGE